MRILKYFAGAVIMLIAALFFGAVPFTVFNDENFKGEKIVRIYVLSNGFHSDIAVPRLEGATLKTLGLAEEDYPVALKQVEYWAIGWGSKTAYTSLMAISDLTARIIVRALAFDETVMHITPLGPLAPAERVFALDISQAQYDTLLAGIKRFFATAQPIDVTQGLGDRFYPGEGYFAPWLSCNTWTGRRLREAGIGVGIWTPLSQSLEFGLHAVASNP